MPNVQTSDKKALETVGNAGLNRTHVTSRMGLMEHNRPVIGIGAMVLRLKVDGAGDEDSESLLLANQLIRQAGGFGKAEAIAASKRDLGGGIEGEAVADADVDGLHFVAGTDGHADGFVVVDEERNRAS